MKAYILYFSLYFFLTLQHTVPIVSLSIIAEIDVFLKLSCFFNDPSDVGNLISGSSAFSKTSLNIWKFTINPTIAPTDPRAGWPQAKQLAGRECNTPPPMSR